MLAVNYQVIDLDVCVRVSCAVFASPLERDGHREIRACFECCLRNIYINKVYYVKMPSTPSSTSPNRIGELRSKHTHTHHRNQYNVPRFAAAAAVAADRR